MNAIVASKAFSERLLDDLDASLWDTADPSTIDVRDYLLGAARAVASNLQNVAVHFKSYGELRYQQDGEMRILLTKTGRPFPSPGLSPRFDEREAQLDATEQALYVAAGAALDCLAAVLAGVAGLRIPLQRVDYGMLLPVQKVKAKSESEFIQSYDRRLLRGFAAEGTELREIQDGAVQALQGAATASGPEGWLTWLLGMRNMSVHREHRLELISTARTPHRGRVVVDRLGPADPDQSNMAALRMAEDQLEKFYIHEDLGVTLNGILGSLNTTVIGVIAVLENVWTERKARPVLTVPAAEQWKSVVQRQTFGGYQPGPMGISSKNSVLMMNPSEARRMRIGGLITPTP